MEATTERISQSSLREGVLSFLNILRDHVKQNPSEISANKLFLCYVAGSEHATKLKYGLFHKVQGSRVKNYNWSSLE